MLSTDLVIQFRTNNHTQAKLATIMRIMVNVTLARRPHHLRRSLQTIHITIHILRNIRIQHNTVDLNFRLNM